MHANIVTPHKLRTTTLMAAATVMALCGLAVADNSAQPSSAERGSVRTIAGSGLSGFADGAAATATFMLPSAIAIGRDGTMYITDEAAQRIRALTKSGTVITVAGSGDAVAPGLSVKGGYRDGPARQAEFNRPTGIAISPTGAIYVADSVNGCIRKIEHAIVSTAVGKCGDLRVVDGSREDGRLVDPRGVVFSPEGELFIADYGGGLREFDESHGLSTIAVGDKRVMSVTVASRSSQSFIVASTPEYLYTYDRSAKSVAAISQNGSEGNRFFGRIQEIAAISPYEFVFTDTRSSMVRYYRPAMNPYVTTPFVRRIAGGAAERQIDNAGFQDGTWDNARFNSPTGLAIMGRTVIVADSGNRRIRAVSLPATSLPGFGLQSTDTFDNRHYEIVYIGASWVFWDTWGPDSICGNLESRVNSALHPAKPVRCHTVRIDAAPIQTMQNYLENFLLDQPVSLVIVNMNLGQMGPLFHNVPSPTEADAAEVKAYMVELKQQLAKKHIALMLHWTNTGDEVSAYENLYEREMRDTGHRFYPGDSYAHNTALLEGSIMPALARVPINQYNARPDFIAYAKLADAKPLFGTDDSHLTPHGAEFIATGLANYLIRTGLPASSR